LSGLNVRVHRTVTDGEMMEYMKQEESEEQLLAADD
jgi:hypothetical protein